MELRWALRARDGLRSLHDDYRDNSPDLADRILEAVELAPDILSIHPYAGAPLQHPTLRKWGVRGLPFVFLYRVARGRVEIARVVHAATDWRRT